MAEKLSITQRLQVLATGKTKAFIPSLSQIDSGGYDTPLIQLTQKPDQLRANIGWVFAANSAIAEFCAAVDLKLYKNKADGEREEIKSHELLDLLDNPMKAHTGEMMRQLHHTYLNLTGDSYLLMVKGGNPFEVKKGQLPDALQVLPAHLVDLKLGENRYSDSVVKYGQKEYKITEVIRDFVPDPGSPYHGRSIVAAASAAIDVDEQMQSWNRRTFKNNARPGLVLNLTGENVDADSVERIKQQLDSLYTSDGAFKSLVLQNGEVKPYMLNHQDLDFLASREFTRDEILAMFKVPGAVLGKTSDFNRANMDAAIYVHLILNVVPRLRHEVRMWNNQLVKPFDPSLELDFDNPVPEDVEAKLKEAEAATNTWMTIDEVRATRGLEPLENNMGAQMYVPLNSIPLSQIATDRPAAKPSSDENAETTGTEDDGDDEMNTEGKKGLPKPAKG